MQWGLGRVQGRCNKSCRECMGMHEVWGRHKEAHERCTGVCKWLAQYKRRGVEWVAWWGRFTLTTCDLPGFPIYFLGMTFSIERERLQMGITWQQDPATGHKYKLVAKHPYHNHVSVGMLEWLELCRSIITTIVTLNGCSMNGDKLTIKLYQFIASSFRHEFCQ